MGKPSVGRQGLSNQSPLRRAGFWLQQGSPLGAGSLFWQNGLQPFLLPKGGRPRRLSRPSVRLTCQTRAASPPSEEGMLPGCPTSRPPPRQSSGCSQRLREVQNVEPAHGTNTRTRTEQGQQSCLQTGRPCPREDSTAQEPRQLRICFRLKPAPCGGNFRACTYQAATRHHAWHILSVVSVLGSFDQIS